MSLLFGQMLYDWATNWLMPIWLLAIGALMALVILAALWVVAFVVGKIPGMGLVDLGAKETNRIVREGPLGPLMVVIFVML